MAEPREATAFLSDPAGCLEKQKIFKTHRCDIPYAVRVG